MESVRNRCAGRVRWEPLGGVGIHDLAPDVGVVGRRVASGEAVGEVGGAVAGRDQGVVDARGGQATLLQTNQPPQQSSKNCRKSNREQNKGLPEKDEYG